MLPQYAKKTEKTPRKELDIARRRMNEAKRGEHLNTFKTRTLARPGVKQAY